MRDCAIAFTIVFLVFLPSCSNNLQKIMDDYNSNFGIVPEGEEQEENAKLDSMLLSRYSVPVDTFLVIPAPEGCTEYEWKLVDNAGIQVYPESGRYTERIFSLYFTSKYEIGVAYKLELSVDMGGKKYFDSCDIIVFSYEPIKKI